MSAEQPASPPPPAAARAGRPGNAWWIAVAVIAATIAVYFQTFVDLWPKWTGGTESSYSHGPLIAAVSLWLIWRARADLHGVVVRPALWALPAALALSLLWLVAARAHIMTVYAALWPLLGFAILLAACGWRVARVFAFAFAYLWFAVPMWDYLTRLLQTLTVIVVGAMNTLTRVPSEVVGDFVYLPQGTFEIAAGCSGLHFFMVALAIGALAGEVHRDRWPTRLLLVALAAALALVTNWLRVYIIILAGYLSDMQHYLVTVDHYKFGWVIFAVAMAAYFFVLHRLPSHPEVPAAVAPAAAGPRSAAGAALAVGLLAVLLLPLASWIARQAAPSPPLAPLAPAVADFAGPLAPGPLWRPEYQGETEEARVTYLSPAGRALEVYVNRYVEQAQGAELIGYDNRLFDPRDFRLRSASVTTVTVPGGAIDAVEARLDTRFGEPWIALYRYYVGDKTLTTARVVQVATGLQGLWRPVPAGLTAVATACAGDCEAARLELAMLLGQLEGK